MLYQMEISKLVVIVRQYGSVNPAQEEIAVDGVDQNCDAVELCYVDADEDGFGTEATDR